MNITEQLCRLGWLAGWLSLDYSVICQKIELKEPQEQHEYYCHLQCDVM
jgi:hypothetical protein